MEHVNKPRTSKNYPTLDLHEVLADHIDMESLLKQLKDYGYTSKQRLTQLIDTSEHILYNQPNILNLSSPIRIIGDIHGQFYDLLHILENYGHLPTDKFLFLGDYVDRGNFCIQVMTLLLALKCKFPNNIFLLRGNHQGKTMTQHFNFKLQCVKKYDSDIYQRFLELFCKLPLCALVDKKYFCVHGGISPDLKKIKQLQKMERFKEIQNAGLICDLLWSDPVNNNLAIWQKNKIRSCSYVFGRKHAEKFLSQNKIQMIIRGHQVQMKGFAYQMSDFRKKLTLTLFSAPNYCDTYKNKGGIAIINKGSLTIESFAQSSHPFVFPNYMNVFEWSFPVIATKASKMFIHLLKMMDKDEQQNFSRQNSQVMNKLECLSNILENKNTINFQLLLSPDEINQKLGDQDFEEYFSNKKINDKCEKYPHLPPSVIGPQRVQFKKVRLISQEDQETVEPLTNQTWESTN